MMTQYFKPPDHLNYDTPQELPTAWEKWKRDFTIFMEATESNAKADAVKVSMLLNLIGAKGVELYDTFTYDTVGDDKKLNKVLEKFEEHVKLHKSVTVNRYVFFMCNQKENQTLEDYIKELTIKCNECGFDQDQDIKESLLRDRIISGISDKRLQEKLLRLEDTKSTLKTIINTCRTHEVSIGHSGTFDNDASSSVNRVGERQHGTNGTMTRRDGTMTQGYGTMTQRDGTMTQRNGTMTQRDGTMTGQGRTQMQRNFIVNCVFCGSNHLRGQCPAYGKTCRFCKKLNHYENVCNQKKKSTNRPVNQINEEGTSESSQTISTVSSATKDMFICKISENKPVDKWSTEILIEDELTLNIKVDCGADVSIINYQEFMKLRKSPKLTKCNVKYKAYNNTAIPVHGKCMLQVESKFGLYHVLEFIVADYESVLSGDHSVTLGLLKKLFKVNELYDGVTVNPDIFNEIGCLDGEIKLFLKEDAVPVIHPPRKVPLSLYDPLKAKLDKMEHELDVIYRVEEPTEWVSSLVIVEKPNTNGSLRICLDPKDLNKAIKRQHYPIPTNEDIFDKLKGATVYSKLDAASGYWQIKVDKETSKLLCFNTPFGRYAFKRLPFGIHAASEIFQQKIELLLEGIAGQANVQDDIIVWGKDKHEHDKRLQEVLDRIYKSGIRLNKDKCVIGKDELIFLGHKITKDGIMPDPRKISAISNLKLPSDKAGVQRILGMINYVGKFIPHLSDITKPFRGLIDKDCDFKITTEHANSLLKIKDILTSNPILRVFDSSKQTKVSADASEYGIGAVLLQKHEDSWFPVSYASRTLTKTEQNYAQIEKECLAIVFACTRFHHYTYGRTFTCENDHKPLESLFKKSISEVPARIQRMMLYLQKYPDMKVVYVPGSSLKIADALSRAPEDNIEGPEIKDIEGQVHMIIQSHPISDAKLNEFRLATSQDSVLCSLMNMIKTGWPNDYKYIPKHLNDYWQYRDCLTTDNGIIYKGEQIVVPTVLRGLVKEKIHEGHLGIGKCTLRAKTYFFWPHMRKSIEDLVKACSVCQEHRNEQPKQPNISREVKAPWNTIGCDIFHYGICHYLIMTDYFSGFPEVLLLNKGAGHGTSELTIEKMKSIFARHGIPEELISDGGPQFNSSAFEQFAKSWGFQHEMSDPYFPRGNGKVERSVETVKNLIRKAHASNTDVYGAILAYRTTPLQDCGKSPAELLMNRTIKTRLNAHVCQPDSNIQRQNYNPKYANMHTRVLPPLNVNDNVRVRHQNKWALKAKVVGNYKQNPRSYIVETSEGQQLRRNRQHLLPTSETWTSTPEIAHLDDDYIYGMDEPVENDTSADNTDTFLQNFELNNIEIENALPSDTQIITQFDISDFRRYSTRPTMGKIDRYTPYSKPDDSD